jgi:Fe-S-cluster-containing hydrogenase component 2
MPNRRLVLENREVEIAEELCIYCGACVLACIVDNCIMITRTRPNGKVERFANPQQFMALQHKINSEKRLGKIREAFPQLKKNPRHTKKIGKKMLNMHRS